MYTLHYIIPASGALASHQDLKIKALAGALHLVISHLDAHGKWVPDDTSNTA